jgi:hypothetical protein
MGKNQPCPIPITHKRLIEAHHLWHQAANSYQDPVGFNANLNACIQTLRNITFALQNEKKSIPNFDNWYKSWQLKLKNDEVLSWLHDARTKVVHQKDLEIKSTAIATIQTYIDLAKIRIEVPPFLPTNLIASYIAKKNFTEIPPDILKIAIIQIERRWVEKNLENWELLDALSYAFKVLKDIVIEAHQLLECSSCDIFDTLHFQDILKIQDKLPCMEDFNSIRVMTFSISDKKCMAADLVEISNKHKDLENAAKRYNIKKMMSPGLFSYDAIKMAESLVEFSKKLLAKDKHHTSIVFLRLPEGRWQMYNMLPKDRSEKYMLWRLMAEEVERTKADALVDINEAWFGKVEPLEKEGLFPDEQLDRKEALQVSVLTAEGLQRSYITPFTRNHFGKIIFEQTEILENTETFYLLPICKIWGIDINKT